MGSFDPTLPDLLNRGIEFAGKQHAWFPPLYMAGFIAIAERDILAAIKVESNAPGEYPDHSSCRAICSFNTHADDGLPPSALLYPPTHSSPVNPGYPPTICCDGL